MSPFSHKNIQFFPCCVLFSYCGYSNAVSQNVKKYVTFYIYSAVQWWLLRKMFIFHLGNKSFKIHHQAKNGDNWLITVLVGTFWSSLRSTSRFFRSTLDLEFSIFFSLKYSSRFIRTHPKPLVTCCYHLMA